MVPLVCCFPLGPGLVPLRALFPIIIYARKALTCEHGRTCKKEQGSVGDCSTRPSGFPLHVLEHVYLIGDALNLKVVALHFIMQRQEVEGVPAGAPHLEVGKDVLGDNLSVEQVGVSQFANPGVGDDVEHELCCLLSRRFIRSAIGALCFVCRFGARTDNGRGDVVNVCIVGPDSFRLGECLVVASNLSSFRPNKANEVVDRTRFVIQDLKEEKSDGLSKSREVGVGRLSVDGLKVVKGVGEFCHNLFGGYAAPAKMAGPSS